MSNLRDSRRDQRSSRRDFLQTSSAAAVATGLASRLAAAPIVHLGGSQTLRLGLVGCGSRGTGAADQAMQADDNVKLAAMADVFGDRLEASRARLRQRGGDKFDVSDDRCFVGFDACRQLIDSGVDVVLLASNRSGSAVNNGEYAAKSTLMAIMGRMASYTGQQVTWEQAWNSQENLTPERYEFGPLAVPPVAVPGVTRLR